MASSDKSPQQSESKPNGDVEVKTPHRRRVVALAVGSIAAVAVAVAVVVPLLCCKDVDKGGGKATNQLGNYDNSSNTDIVSFVSTTATPFLAVTDTYQRVATTTKRTTDTASPNGRDASSSSVNIKTTASTKHRFSTVSPLTVEAQPTVGSLLFPSFVPLSVGSVWINSDEATSQVPSSVRSELPRTHVGAEISSSVYTTAPSHPSPVPNPVISSSVAQTSPSLASKFHSRTQSPRGLRPNKGLWSHW